MPLYHFTMTRLGPGSIIQPGNWGRLLRRYENDKDPTGAQFGSVWVLTRELLFELQRVQSFPGKPSRFESTFCLPDRAQADRYRALADIHFAQMMHEVEHVDPVAASHEGFLENFVWPPGGAPFMGVMGTRAAAYWQGQGSGPREIVSLSPLQVIACLE